MKKIILIFLLTLPTFSFSQIQKLDVRFQDLSWITDEKASEIVATLSFLYSNDSLKNDTNYVSKERYNLYYDSLSLWYITSKNYCVDNDATKKSSAVGKFADVHTNSTIEEDLGFLSFGTKSAYSENGNSTIKGKKLCVPSSWENLNLFYKEESGRIKTYNDGRIKSYYYKTEGNENGYIKSVLYFHKSIKPSSVGMAQMGLFNYWAAYALFYDRPKLVVYPANIEKTWTSKTGLPYDVAQQLNLDKNRIRNVLKKMPKYPNFSLVNFGSDSIFVNCDTCKVIFQDNKTEDGDVIDYYYQTKKERVFIKNEGTLKIINITKSNDFFMRAISKGSMGACTVSVIIEGITHSYNLQRDEIINIKLVKKEQSTVQGNGKYTN